jgi:hypothetical protein
MWTFCLLGRETNEKVAPCPNPNSFHTINQLHLPLQVSYEGIGVKTIFDRAFPRSYKTKGPRFRNIRSFSQHFWLMIVPHTVDPLLRSLKVSLVECKGTNQKCHQKSGFATQQFTSGVLCRIHTGLTILHVPHQSINQSLHVCSQNAR